MSEKFNGSHEQNSGEKLNLESESRKNLEAIHKKAEQSQEMTEKHVEQAKSKVEKQAISGKEYSVGEREKPTGHSTSHVSHKALKADSFKKTMSHARQKLPKSERTFSKLIHNKKVEAVSEVSSKTIARPSGILGGGIFALTGSILLLYMAKHYGFEYNFIVFILFFVGGFFIGSLVEITLKAFTKPHRSKY